MREFYAYEEREIVSVRIRLDWRGRPVTQVGRKQVRLRMIPGHEHEDTGRIIWSDAHRSDAIELAAFLRDRCK